MRLLSYLRDFYCQFIFKLNLDILIIFSLFRKYIDRVSLSLFLHRHRKRGGGGGGGQGGPPMI